METPQLIFVTGCNSAGKSSFIRTRISDLPTFEIIMPDVYKSRTKKHMILKASLLLVLIFAAQLVKSQDLLNADSSHIQKQMVAEGGTLLMDKTTHYDLGNPGYHQTIIYTSSRKKFNSTGINMTVFYMTDNNKCYKYLVSYKNDDSNLHKLINAFNKPGSGYKQVKEGSKWINQEKKHKVSILPALKVNGKKSMTFFLEFKNE